MKKYYYPKNLKATTVFWFWSARDLLILIFGVLLGFILWTKLGTPIGVVAVGVYGLMSFRLDQTTVIDYIEYGLKYLIFSPQYFEWRKE